MTRAVFFDVDGVLVHGYHSRPEKQQRWDINLLADLGVDPDRFRDEFIFGSFVKQVLVGQMSLVDALDRVLPGLGYRGSSMRFVDYWLSHDSQVNAPLIEVVRALKAGGDCRLFMATNQDHMRAQWLWMTLGFGELFEDIFYAARIGAIKPARPYFDWITARIGPQDEVPLFFDDSPKVIAAARDYGWEAVLFDEVEDCTSHAWIAAQLGAIAKSPSASADEISTARQSRTI